MNGETPTAFNAMPLQVNRAIAMVSSAAEADITFTYVDAARSLGEMDTTYKDVAWQAIKRVVPFMHPREQKMRLVIDVQQGEAIAEDRERTTNTMLSDWLSGLDEPEREEVSLEDSAYGDPFMSSLHLTTTPFGAESPKVFDLGYHLDFSSQPEVLDALPESAKRRLDKRKQFWNGFGVENESELETFIAEHFDKIPVDIPGGEVPSELGWLQAADPKAFGELERIQRYDHRYLYLWRLKRTPDAVIDDALSISANTQHNFISTWLPALMKRQYMPTILESDRDAVTQAAVQARTAIESAPRTEMSDFMRQLLLKDLQDNITKNANYDQSVTHLQRLRGLVLGLEIEGDTTLATRAHIDVANELLDLDLSGELAAQRVTTDTVLRTSESILKALNAIIVLVPGASGLQHVPIKAVADFAYALGPGEDVARTFGEGMSLRERGILWKEIGRRFSVVLPVAIGAMALGSQVENIANFSDPRIAAFLYAVSTCVTTLATLTVTLKAQMNYYTRLAEEGKVEGRAYLPEQQIATLEAAAQTSDTNETTAAVDEPSPAVLSILGALQQRSDIDQHELEKSVQAILTAIKTGHPEKIAKHIQPSNWAVFRAAFRETFGINPYHRGSLAAILAMPLGASMLGGALLSNPLYFVPYGMGETVGALIDAKITGKRENTRWEKTVQNHTQAIKDIRKIK